MRAAGELISLLGVEILLSALGFLLAPKLRFLRHSNVSASLGRLIGFAFPTALIAILASVGAQPLQHPWALRGLLGISVFALALHAYRIKRRPAWSIFFRWEALRLGVLLLWLGVLGWNPGLNFLEKFMNFGFARNALESGLFPPPDPFLSGNPINYYFLGHLQPALLSALSGVRLEITWNFFAASLFSSCFVALLGIGGALAPTRWRPLGAAITAAYVLLLGNFHSAICKFTPGMKCDGWEATRFIRGAIHEMPFYSFAVNDLHAHVLALPFFLLWIARRLIAHTVHWSDGLLMFGMLWSNPWYAPVAAFLAAMVELLGSVRRAGLFSRLRAWFPAILVALIASIPFYLGFTPFSAGWKTVSGEFRTPLALWLLAWSLQLMAVLLAWVFRARLPALRLWPRAWIALLLTAAGSVILPEFLYVHTPNAPEGYRVDTVYKFWYAAWILLGIAVPALILRATNLRRSLLAIAIPALLGSVYLPLSYLSLIRPHSRPWTWVDASLYLQKTEPGAREALSWLRARAGPLPPESRVIAEAPGKGFTHHGRFGVFGGVSVLGWAPHEYFWRPDRYEEIVAREHDLKTLFESGKESTVREILTRYSVRFVVFGDLERKTYAALKESPFSGASDVPRFQSDHVTIYDVGSWIRSANSGLEGSD